MKDFVIITDSSCDMPQELADELGLVVMPLSVTVDGETYKNYLDEREIASHDFYEKLRSGKMAVTAAANISDFEGGMRKVLEEGKDVLYLGFSSALSSTYSAGAAMAAELAEEFPDRKVYAFDTLCASMGQGLLIYLAAQKALEGADIDETLKYVEETRPHLAHWFTVDDLYHLKRGGRVSAATAIVGSALNIKPILHVDDEGRLINVGKVRGRKKSVQELAERMAKTAINPSEQTIFISHGDCIEDAEYLAQIIKERMNVRDVIISPVGPVIGAHSGPGTLALFFLATNRD